MSIRCISLLSGGLDSLLTLRLLALQGLEVIALHAINCFHGTQPIETKKEALRVRAAKLGAADIVFPDLTEEVLEVTRRPRYGYGRHLNACIDCRLKTVAEGFRTMTERNAAFVASGEVVGQRPMSQRREVLKLVDRLVAEWGYPGRLLRPLSAKLLEKTIPEIEGWVSPEHLHDISGRGRERQMRLAGEYDLGEYPSPAGGCLLTDPGFSQRLAGLMRFKPDWGVEDVELLKVGRHFQISPASRVVVSRREEENSRLRELARSGDFLYINAQQNGAIVLIRGDATPEARAVAAGLAIYYSKMREKGRAMVTSWRIEGMDISHETLEAEAFAPEQARELEHLNFTLAHG
ncbi:MAG: tRNA 4-thiouridine(8) synthase ThiI [Planctomycetes bacterium]|nr:tRNA 4-thiouridine(8) synthase ThiI [Planctomycetota bacterium]